MNESNYPTIIHALLAWSDRKPDAIAVTDGDTEISYRKLAEQVEAAAQRLTTLGVGRQDRIIVVGDNTWQWVVCYLATMRIGAIAVPMNNRLAPAQVGELVELLGSKIALADDSHAGMFDGCPNIDVYSITATGVPHSFFELPFSVDLGDLPIPSEDALISFTSGTTGIPKGAVITHSALRKAVQVYADLLGEVPSHSTLIVAPLFHNTGFVDQLCTMILCGGRADLLLRYRTQAAVDACRRRPVTFVTAVPSVLRMMMTAEDADAIFGRARLVLFGGSPMPAPWSLEMNERWPFLHLIHGYGLTEFTSCCTLLPAEMILSHGDSIGFPVKGVELRLVDEAGRDVAPGVAGEIWVRGASRMREYWRRPDVTAEKIEGDWLRTGDLAERKDLGLLYHVGRQDDVINRGGEKILPSFIEGVIATVPEIAQAVVFSIPHPVMQNSVLAALEPRPGKTVDVPVLVEFLRTRLPGYAVPEAIMVSADLPRTASGKLDRRAVRAAYLSALANPSET